MSAGIVHFGRIEVRQDLSKGMTRIATVTSGRRSTAPASDSHGAKPRCAGRAEK
jgi:hypothetical protein